MKKGNKKSSIIDRAKSNMEKNRKKQKLKKILKKLFKYFNTFNGRFVLIFLFTVIGFAALIGRVYYLQTKGGEKIREDSEKKYSYKTYKKAKTEIGGGYYDSLILKVSSDIINTVRYLANADISKVDELVIPDDKFNEYWMFLRRYAAYHWGKLNLKSESVLCKTLSKR